MAHEHHEHDQRRQGSSEAEPDRSLPVIEERFDPANQALADALRLSFNILKAVMVVLIVLFLGSGFFVVGPDQAGIILRFGKIRGDKSTQVRKSGYYFAFPAPIEEKILVPTKYKQMEIKTFYFKVAKQDELLPLDRMPGGLLQPGLDGAMLTGDKNIVHAVWTVQYRIVDPVRYVENVYNTGQGETQERERSLVRASLENSLVWSVARRAVDDVIRGPGLEDVLEDARVEMQRQLDGLHAGIEVNWIKYVKHPPTPPLMVRSAFNRVLQAESDKLREVETARTKANEILIGAGGERYTVLTDRLKSFEVARKNASPKKVAEMERELGRFFDANAGGEAINRIQKARAFATSVEQEIKSDYEQFSRLLPEYKKNPLVVMRQQYYNVIPGILAKAKKWYVSSDATLMIDMRPPPDWAREAARKRFGVSTENQH